MLAWSAAYDDELFDLAAAVAASDGRIRRLASVGGRSTTSSPTTSWHSTPRGSADREHVGPGVARMRGDAQIVDAWISAATKGPRSGVGRRDPQRQRGRACGRRSGSAGRRATRSSRSIAVAIAYVPAIVFVGISVLDPGRPPRPERDRRLRRLLRLHHRGDRAVRRARRPRGARRRPTQRHAGDVPVDATASWHLPRREGDRSGRARCGWSRSGRRCWCCSATRSTTPAPTASATGCSSCSGSSCRRSPSRPR